MQVWLKSINIFKTIIFRSNKKPIEKLIKYTNEKEIKIEDDLEDLNIINKDKNLLLSTTNKSNIQKYKKVNDVISLNSTPKSSVKYSINEKSSKINNTNISNFTSNVSSSQNLSNNSILYVINNSLNNY